MNPVLLDCSVAKSNWVPLRIRNIKPGKEFFLWRIALSKKTVFERLSKLRKASRNLGFPCSQFQISFSDRAPVWVSMIPSRYKAPPCNKLSGLFPPVKAPPKNSDKSDHRPSPDPSPRAAFLANSVARSMARLTTCSIATARLSVALLTAPDRSSYPLTAPSSDCARSP
jgi:hypothetical protein